jgi:hypothetical protein
VVIRRVQQDRNTSRRNTAEYATVIEWSFGIDSCRNGKKGIRRCQKDFTCDLKLQCDCDKSVARMRLVKTENPSACETVSWKVCRIAIAL